MAKVSDEKKICSLCGSKTSEFRGTLYGALICPKCHNLLMGFGVRSEEDVERMIQNEENWWTKYLEDFKRDVRCRKPSSWTREKIKSAAFRIGILTFFTTWFIAIITFVKNTNTVLDPKESLLWMLLIWGSIYPIIPSLLSIIVGEFYFKSMVKLKQSLIKEDLERDKNKIEQEKNEKIEQAERKAKWHSSRGYGYSRYQKIISKATKEKILLYEYFLGEYPPDWEYRSKVVRNRDGNRCRKCGEEGVLHVHHINSVKGGGVSIGYGPFRTKRGGNHFLDNLISLCKNCHLEEHPYLSEKIHENKK